MLMVGINMDAVTEFAQHYYNYGFREGFIFGIVVGANLLLTILIFTASFFFFKTL